MYASYQWILWYFVCCWVAVWSDCLEVSWFFFASTWKLKQRFSYVLSTCNFKRCDVFFFYFFQPVELYVVTKLLDNGLLSVPDPQSILAAGVKVCKSGFFEKFFLLCTFGLMLHCFCCCCECFIVAWSPCSQDEEMHIPIKPYTYVHFFSPCVFCLDASMYLFTSTRGFSAYWYSSIRSKYSRIGNGKNM